MLCLSLGKAKIRRNRELSTYQRERFGSSSRNCHGATTTAKLINNWTNCVPDFRGAEGPGPFTYEPAINAAASWKHHRGQEKFWRGYEPQIAKSISAGKAAKSVR